MTVDEEAQVKKRMIRNVARLTTGAIMVALVVAAGLAAARSSAWAAGIGSATAVLAVLLTVFTVVRHRRQ